MSARARTRSLAAVAGGQPAWLDRVQRRLGTTPTGLAILGLALAGGIAGRMLASRVMFVLVYGAIGLVLVGRFLNRRTLAVDVCRSKIPMRVREGQRVEVELELAARRRVSTILVEEELHASLGGPVRVPIPVLPAGEVCRHEYSFAPRRRGVYTVGPLLASWSDPFGVNQQSTVLADAVELVVHPSTELVHDRVVTREWEDPPVRPPSSKPWPTGFEFYGVRDYVDGDDPRRIVWRATARTLDENGGGRYLVRESEQGITDRVGLILDTDRSRHTPGDVSESFEAAVRVCASLGARHLDDGFSVSLDANSGALAKGLRGRRSRIELLDALARVQREKPKLADAVDRVLLTGRRTVHNVLVTPSLDHETASRLRLLRERGVSLLVVVVQWDGTDPASVRRAAAIGCNIVEIQPGAPLEVMFQHLATGGRQ